MRLGLLFLPLALCGCLNWQEGYNNAARSDCRQNVNADERRACLERVEDSAADHRAAQRGG